MDPRPYRPKLESLHYKRVRATRVQGNRRRIPLERPTSREGVRDYPLLVRRRGKDFVLVAGEEYFDAAVDAGVAKVTVVVIDSSIEELRAITFGDVERAAAVLRDLHRIGYLDAADVDLDGDEIDEWCEELMPSARNVSEVWKP